MTNFVKEFNSTGECIVDIEKICQKWNHLYLVYRYDETYRFIKYKRKDSQIREIKVEISKEQALAVIKRMNLVETPGYPFVKVSTYRPVDN